MNFTVKTNTKDEVVDITDDINELIKKSGKKDGIIVLNLLHTTCALTTADLDPGTDKDILEAVRKMIPQISFRHPHDPTHTPDHILSSILGTSLSLIFENNELQLGDWQRVILVELNGPSERKINYSIS
ncbi:MAG: YjbQ family protein [Candidatus Levybacteria bacterium]|nr:YjbQ family protein [Candidatus Levybacteria bacterium]